MFSKNIIFFVFEDRKIKFLKLFSIVNYIKMFVRVKENNFSYHAHLTKVGSVSGIVRI